MRAYVHNGNCQNRVTHVTRAGLGALGKFNSSGPQKLFIQKLLSIIQQFTRNINTLLCMRAHTILTTFVKTKVSYCYCVYTAVSTGYSMCYP